MRKDTINTNFKKKIYIGRTPINGRGIFAALDIEKDEVIFVVRGRLYKDPKYCKGYLDQGSHWLGVGRASWLILLRSNPGWFINHSCQPNAGLRGRRTVVAMRSIKRGEEITIDYSTTEEDPYWQMRCSCKSRNCRGLIRGVHSLPGKVFRRYGAYIPRFFRESYLRNRK